MAGGERESKCIRTEGLFASNFLSKEERREERIIMARARSVLVVAALFLLARLTVAQQSVQHVAVHAGNVLDVTSGKLLPDQVIVVEGEKIVSVGPAAASKVAADAKRIDLPNATILPGLIDAHTHLTADPKFGYDRLAVSVPRETLIGRRMRELPFKLDSRQCATWAPPDTAT
jgi:hypothetical protein